MKWRCRGQIADAANAADDATLTRVEPKVLLQSSASVSAFVHRAHQQHPSKLALPGNTPAIPALQPSAPPTTVAFPRRHPSGNPPCLLGAARLSVAMSFSQFHMPGAYHFDQPASTSPGPVLSAGIFRPPISPSASSSVLNLARSTGSLCSDTTPAPKTRRKRTRDDVGDTPTGWTTMTADELETPMEKNAQGARRYTLAGQIETPGAVVGNPMEESMYSDVDYRRALGSKRTHDEMESPSRRWPEPAATAPPTANGESWPVLSAIGGMVGKVWDFCRGGAFRGFYAGGGEGYDVTPSGVGKSGATGKVWCNEHDVPTLPGEEPLLSPGALPGGFPEADYMSQGQSLREKKRPEPVSRPSAKRRQVSEVGDELRRNWVMVDSDEEEPRRKRAPATHPRSTRSGGRSQRPSLPNRRISVPVSRLNSETPSQNRRTSVRISQGGSPSISTASYAPSRSPVTASPATFGRSAPPANPFARAASPRPSSAAGSPIKPGFTPGHARHASGASAASTGRRKGLEREDIEASPRLDAEAKRLAVRKVVAEREADVRMEALSRQMREMIRQGREALGSTIQVEEYGEGLDTWDDV
jgi:hypothetical protein